MEELIKRILAMVDLRGTTLNAVSEQAGMARGHIYNLVSGRRTSLDATTLLAIAKALNVTTDWLLTGEGPIERPAPVKAPEPPPETPIASATKKLRTAKPRRRLAHVAKAATKERG